MKNKQTNKAENVFMYNTLCLKIWTEVVHNICIYVSYDNDNVDCIIMHDFIYYILYSTWAIDMIANLKQIQITFYSFIKMPFLWHHLLKECIYIYTTNI